MTSENPAGEKQMLDDETFMSVADLKKYVMERELAKASASAMSPAEKARKEYLQKLMFRSRSRPIESRIAPQSREDSRRARRARDFDRPFSRRSLLGSRSRHQSVGSGLAGHPHRLASAGLRSVEGDPSAAGLRPQIDDRRMAGRTARRGGPVPDVEVRPQAGSGQLRRDDRGERDEQEQEEKGAGGLRGSGRRRRRRQRPGARRRACTRGNWPGCRSNS